MEAKRWCFTINNPEYERPGHPETDYWFTPHINHEQQMCDEQTMKRLGVTYLVCQEERGEEGTFHLQGFVIFEKKKRLTWLKRNVNERAHWEVARATPQKAAEYCKKQETRAGWQWEYGELPHREEVKKPNERLQDAAEELDIIKEGYKRPSEIPSITLMQCGFLAAYKELTADILGPYRPNLKVITLVGPPGVGKSFAIQKIFPDHGRIIMGNNGVWTQQPLAKVMVLEEFVGQIQLQRMLQLLDPYPLALEIKGGMRPAMYEIIIITSNTRPDGWYKGDEAGTPGKRTDAIYALWDRLGFSNGSFIPVRKCGTYIEAPAMLSIDEKRRFYMLELMKAADIAEPVSDDEDGAIASYMLSDNDDTH